MVSHAVRQTYTYYFPDEPRGRVIKDAPLSGHGKAWTLGEYHHPAYPSPLNVRVGDSGISVSTVISWLRANDNDKSRVLEHYGQVLQSEDIDTAIWFYSRYKEEIDAKLADTA